VKTLAQIDVHLNDLGGGSIGVTNLGSGATMNWWGCSGGPTAHGCSSVQGTGITFAPWLTKPANQSEQHDDRREDR
jgi:hypothetical protein